MSDRFTPHAYHQIIPFLMMLLAAALVGLFPGWVTSVIFICTAIGATATMLWIAWAGKVREEADYWWNIGQDVELLRKSEPDIWHTLGYKNPPKYVYLRKEVTGEEGRSPIYEEERYTFELSPAEMNFLANEVLSGKRTLAETEWVGTPIGSTRIREVKHKMLKAELIAKAHPSAATQGFIPTDEGIEYFFRYASDWAKEMYEQRGIKTLKSNTRKNGNDPYPPLSTDTP